MKNVKKILIAFPEYYLILVIFMTGYQPMFSVNPISIVLVLLIALQITSKYRITGIVIAGLFIVTNFYMVLALISEVTEFPKFNSEARTMLFVGLLLFTLNLMASGIMIYKYAGYTGQTSRMETSN